MVRRLAEAWRFFQIGVWRDIDVNHLTHSRDLSSGWAMLVPSSNMTCSRSDIFSALPPMRS